MPEEYKLHLSRSVLFDASPLCAFLCTYGAVIDEKEFLKAYKMLSFKEPLITAAVRLDDNGEGYACIGKAKTEPIFIETNDERAFFNTEKERTSNPFEGFFRFFVLNKRTLAIFANAAVSDCKSLFMITEELFNFYEKKTFDVSPKEIFLYSKKSDVPSNAFSVIIDRITSDIEMKWQKKPKTFSNGDYMRLLEAENKMTASKNRLAFSLDESETAELSKRCADKGIDMSTAACFAFRKAALSSPEFKKMKRKKVNFGADFRIYEEKPYKYGVGPFFARAGIAKPIRRDLKANGELKAFHDMCYKKLANVFFAYYDRVFLMYLSPFLCDAAEFYAAGLYKGKTAKKLAKNYSCLYTPILTFDFFNLDCERWAFLKKFDNILCSEQKSRGCGLSVTLVLKNGRLFFEAEAQNARCSEREFKRICSEALKILKTI